MKRTVSIFILYGLMMTSIELSYTTDVELVSCIKTVQEFIYPAMELLDTLSEVYRVTKRPFQIKFLLEDTFSNFLLSHDCENGDRTSCSHTFERLLGKFHAVINVARLEHEPRSSADQNQQAKIQSNEIAFSVKSLNITDDKSTIITYLCKNIISSLTEKKPCTTAPSLPCDATCNNDKTTLTDSHIPSTSEDIKTKEGFQVSDIVIASLSSFLGGVMCTLLTLFVYRFICGRKPKQESADDHTDMEDERFKTKMHEKDKLKSQSSQMTYETLTSTKSAGTEEEHTGHVYLGLGSNSKCNELSGVRNVKEMALQANSIDSPKHLGREQTKDVRDDHVYNVLKSEEAANVYQSTEAKELNEHTYTKLADRGPEKRHARQESPEEVSESDNSRLSETHNYFILEDEVNDNTGNRIRKTSEVQGIDISMNEIADEQSSFDHAYFTLHKIEDSSCSTPEKEQLNAELDEDVDDDTDGHAYHILERI